MPPSPHPDEEVFGKAYDGKIAGRLLGYLRPYKKQVFVGLVLVLLVGGLQVLGPLIVREAIDSQIEVGEDDRLGKLVLAYVGVLLLIFALSFCQSVLMTYVGQQLQP